MDINVSINGVAGVDRAVLSAAPIALVTGHNGAGKTSIAQAVAAALTGDPLIRGLGARNRLSAVVRGGFEQATAAVGWPDGTVTMQWPDGKVKTEGKPPQASAVAAGMERPSGMNTAQRSVFLTELIGASPTKDDVASALKESGYGEAAIDKLWSGLESDGWDAMHKKVREAGTKLKGAWEHQTGERFGSAKAASWQPSAWSDDLEGKSVDGLEADLASAREDLEKKIGRSAVSADKLAEMKKWADHLPQFETDLAELREQLPEKEKALEDAQAARDALPDVQENNGVPCPHGCEGKRIRIIRTAATTSLEACVPQRLDDEEKKKRRGAIASADGEIGRLQGELDTHKKRIFDTEGGIERAKRAKAELQQSGETDPAAVDAAREAVRMAEERLAAFAARTEAANLYQRYQRNQAVIDLLAPDGLRKTCLARALDAFNKGDLEPLCAPFSLPAVTVDDELDIRMGGRSYGLLSAGEQFAVDAVLQVAAAKRDRSDMVVVDGAEVLVGPRRPGLLKMIAAAKIPAIVCIALKHPSGAPDLAKSGYGNSYWVEGNAAIPFGDLEQEEAA